MASTAHELVGRVFGPTAWRRVEQADVDAERAARESPYGTTVAHGTLTLAMVDGWRDAAGGRG